jgi:hypothetical protein
MLKGIVSRDSANLRPLMYSLGLNNSPRIGFTLLSRASKRNCAANRGSVDVKWRVLDFTQLWQAALKYVPQIVAKRGILPRR